MRAGDALWQMRAVASVDSGKDGVFSVGDPPALLNGCRGNAHSVRRLVTTDTRTTIGAYGLKEWMALGVDGSIDVNDSDLPGRVVIGFESAELSAAPLSPPVAIIRRRICCLSWL